VQLLLHAVGVRRRRWAAAPARPLNGWGALTRAEQSVARLIADGHTNRGAASELRLSPNTIAAHLRSIFGKLDVSSRVQLTLAVIGHT
jgi:DNA-binding NarL/FixJ family response regulator